MDNKKNRTKIKLKQNSLNASIQRHLIKEDIWKGGLKIFPVIRFSMPAGNVMETLEKLIKSPEAAFPCIFINWAESSALWWILEFSRIWKNSLWFIAFEAGFGNSAKSISAISQFVNLSKINQLQRICRQCIILFQSQLLKAS